MYAPQRSPQKNTLKRMQEPITSDMISLDDDDQSVKRLCTRQNPTVCKMCRNNCIERNITCTSCTSAFHLTCVSVPDNFFEYFVIKNKMPWECPLCSMKSNEDAKTKARTIDYKIQKIQEKINTYEKKIDDCEIKLTSQSTQMDMVLNMISKTSEMQEEKMTEFDTKLEATHDRLSKEICFVQGQHRIDELIISGIPHQPNENLKIYIRNIAKVLNVLIPSDGIKKIHRLTGQPEARTNRIAPIMVKFTSQEIRDAINDQYINNMRQKIFLKLSSITTSSNSEARIYINPHLPPCLREIYQKALQHKKDGKIEAVHAKVNAVAVRKDGTWYKIQTQKELNDVID